MVELITHSYHKNMNIKSITGTVATLGCAALLVYFFSQTKKDAVNACEPQVQAVKITQSAVKTDKPADKYMTIAKQNDEESTKNTDLETLKKNYLNAKPNTKERTQAMKALVEAWGKTDPQSAILFVWDKLPPILGRPVIETAYQSYTIDQLEQFSVEAKDADKRYFPVAALLYRLLTEGKYDQATALADKYPDKWLSSMMKQEIRLVRAGVH